MKTYRSFYLTLAATVLIVAGCSSKEASVDTSAFQKSFSSAEATVKTAADQVVSDVKAANYSAASAELQKLAGQAKLTPEQTQAIKDLVAQVQQALTAAGSKAASDAGKAATDLQKSLPK